MCVICQLCCVLTLSFCIWLWLTPFLVVCGTCCFHCKWEGQAGQYDRLKGLKKSEDILGINYFLVQNPSVEILTFPVVLQAIQREKPEKYRKLQDASRSAEALVEQMVNGNYMGVALDNLLRDLINEQVHIHHKNYISTYCLNRTVKWYCLIFLLLFLNVQSVN